MKSLPAFCSSGQARPDTDPSISKHSSPSSSAQHPQTLLSPTIKLPKPPLKWISTNKFHSKETNWSFCAMSCSAGSPLGCLGRQTAGRDQLIPHPFMSWQLPPLSGLKTVCPGIPGTLISDQIISISFPLLVTVWLQLTTGSPSPKAVTDIWIKILQDF